MWVLPAFFVPLFLAGNVWALHSRALEPELEMDGVVLEERQGGASTYSPGSVNTGGQNTPSNPINPSTPSTNPSNTCSATDRWVSGVAPNTDCPSSDGISCEPGNKVRPAPYYVCQTLTQNLGLLERPYVPQTCANCPVDSPDSYVPDYYKPAYTPDQKAKIRDLTCTPSPTNVCPYYRYPKPQGADGVRRPEEFVIDLNHIDQPTDDFSGISYRGLSISYATWNMTKAAAVASLNANASDAVYIIAREIMHAWGTWFPDGVSVITRNPFTPVELVYNDLNLAAAANGLFANVVNQFEAVVTNDSTKFLAIADNLAQFHHRLQKGRERVMKHYHFRTFQRAMMYVLKFFLGNQFSGERATAVEEVVDFVYRFNSMFLIMYDSGCKRSIHYEDFIRDPVPPPPSTFNPVVPTPGM